MVSEELAKDLIADLEKVCDVEFDSKTKDELSKCYQTTIESHEIKYLLIGEDMETYYCKKCGKEYGPHLMKPLTICEKCAEVVLK